MGEASASKTTDIQQKNSKERIIWLDVARSIAIVLVVCCHSIGYIYNMVTVEGWEILSIGSKLFRTITFTISRLGVPIFLFISGKLLLSKKIENTEDCKKFYKRNLLSLIIAVEIWNVIYNIYFAILNNTSFNIKDIILNILFLKNISLANMWYMPMIIGMYIAIPFLAILVKKVDMKLPMILVFITVFLIPSINNILSVAFKEQYNIILDLSFLGGNYGIYILLGYYISEGMLNKIKGWIIILIMILSLSITCYTQIWMFNKGIIYNVWYNSAGILITASCLFELLSRMKIELKQYIRKLVTYISKISLGIFFIHIIVQEVMLKLFTFNIINRPISTIIFTILTLSISVTIIYVLSKIKFIKEKVFLIK